MSSAYDERGTPTGERINFALLEGVFDAGKTRNPNRYPVLHSKAAIARHSMPALSLLVNRLGSQNEAFAHARQVLESYTLFYDILAAHPIWLPPQAAAEAADALLLAGVHHQTLCHQFMEAKRQLWYVTEKGHMAQHLADDIRATHFNARFAWTYGDEDYVGRLKQLGQACLRANGPLKVAGPVLLRYRNLMYIRMQRRLAEQP